MPEKTGRRLPPAPGYKPTLTFSCKQKLPLFVYDIPSVFMTAPTSHMHEYDTSISVGVLESLVCQNPGVAAKLTNLD